MKRNLNIVLAYLIFCISLGTLLADRALAQSSKTLDQKTKGTVLKQEKTGLTGKRDPFVLPRGVRNLTDMAKDPQPKSDDKPSDDKHKDILSPTLEVNAILISDRLRLASIDHQIATVGDLIHDERILEIQTDRIVLEKGDKKRTLLLKQSPVRLTIEDGNRKGESR